jgi:hypothetical protein
MRLLGTARQTAMGLGEEADKEKAGHEVKDAATREQLRQNWAAIDSLVQEFIPEAILRETPKARGFASKKKYWLVKDAHSENNHLEIHESGNWFLQRVDPGGLISVWALSYKGRGKFPVGRPYPVEGLRNGAMRLLNSSP